MGLALAPYVAVMAHDAGATVLLYEPNRCRVPLGGGAACELSIAGDYAREGKVRVEVLSAPAAKFELRLRIPAWSGARTVARLNGKPVKGVKAGYLRLDRVWKKGDRVELELDMAVRVIEAYDASRRFALQRGPLVLAQDSRLGAVDAPFRPVGGRPVKPPKGIFFAYRFDDGTTVCDFASAGNLYEMRNRLCLWMPMAAAAPAR